MTSARDGALEGIHFVKISTLALDEQAPHGFVGYANLRVFHTQCLNPIKARHKRKKNDIHKGCHSLLWRALEDSNLRPTGS